MSPLQIKPGYQPATSEGYHSPLGDPAHVQAAIGHGYHQTSLHRPGHQSPAQSGYHSPVQSGYQSPVASQASFQFPSQPPITNLQHGHHDNLHDPEYEIREFRLSEYPPQVHAQQNTPPLQPSPHQNGPMKSPSRKCWEVTPTVSPSPTAPFTPASSEGVAVHMEEVQEGQGGDGNQYDDASDVPAKKGVAMFIGDESDKPKEVKTSNDILNVTSQFCFDSHAMNIGHAMNKSHTMNKCDIFVMYTFHSWIASLFLCT